MAFLLGIPIKIFSFNGSNSSTCKFQITRKRQTIYKIMSSTSAIPKNPFFCFYENV